jgi:hypothetical protein
MAMSTQRHTSPAESLGFGASRHAVGRDHVQKSGGAELPVLGERAERPEFADMLREASNGLQSSRRRDDMRPAPRRDLERQESLDADRREPAGADQGVRERTMAERADQDQEEAATGNPEAEHTDEEAAANAAAAAQVAQSLTAQLIDEEGEGDAELPVEEALTFQAAAERSESTSDARTGSSPAVPAASSLLPTTADNGVTMPAQGFGEAQGGGAIDLFSSQELADLDVQVEPEGGQMMERLQQALATNHAEDLDELGKPVVPQVVRSMATLARNGVSEMRLQLQPGDLGEIELRVRAVEGMIRGEVMVQHAEVKNLLDSQIERLREALEAQGLQLEGLDVGVSEDGAFARDSDADADPDGLSFGRLIDPADVDSDIVNENANAVPRRPIQLSDDAVDWLV